MRKKHYIGMIACAVVFGIVGSASFEGISYLYSHTVAKEERTAAAPQTKAVASTVMTNQTDSDESVTKVAENVLPSIVAIDVTMTETNSDFFGRTYQQDVEGSGSGIIVAQDERYLYIATNNHVVADAKKVSIKFNDESVCEAEVKGTDSDSDLAVVQVLTKNISDSTLGKIKVATLGESDSVKVGDQAIAIGNALGYGTSVTVGYVSAKEREVAGEDVTLKLLQTDAAINPGNSGGALVNAEGAVIGINSAKYADTEVEGMGFAIPISTAVPIINDIISSEILSENERGYLGISGKEVDEQYAEYYNIPEGVYVAEVSQNSPAEKGGLKKGDIIARLDGREIKSMAGLQDKLSKLRAGTKVKIVVKRSDNGEYKEKECTVTLGKRQ